MAEKAKKKRDMSDVPKRLFQVEEAGWYLGLSPRTIYNGISPRSKDPFPVKTKRRGKKVLFEKKDLDAYADSLPYNENIRPVS